MSGSRSRSPDEERPHSQSNDLMSSQAMAPSASQTTDEDSLISRTRKRSAPHDGHESDHERASKLARISEEPENASVSQSSDGDAMEEDDAISQMMAAPEFPEVEDKIEEAMSSQVQTPDLEPSPPGPSAPSRRGKPGARARGRGRGGRRKGWHLMKENRQGAANGSPAMSDQHESVDAIESNGYRQAGLLQRLPGRKRAPHPDNSVECDMRRQLELRVSFRAVIKALKPVLGELATRTENTLEQDPKLHEQYPEHDEIQQYLEDCLQERLRTIDAQRFQESERLTRMRDADLDMLQSRFECRVDDAQDKHLYKTLHSILSLQRDSERALDDQATDNEGDDVVPPLLRTDPETGVTKPLSDKQNMRRAQKQYDPTTLVPAPSGFAVYDKRQRESARAELRRIGLLDAGRHAREEIAAAETRAAEEARARLQVLASASEAAETNIPAPVSKIEEVIKLQSPRPASGPSKNKGNALSISNLVSPENASTPTKQEPSATPDTSMYKPYQPSEKPPVHGTWHQASPQSSYNAAPPPPPGALFGAFRQEEPHRSSGPREQRETSIHERSQRPSSDYPPHPLGREYADRRPGYVPYGHVPQYGSPPDPFGRSHPHAYAPHPPYDAGPRYDPYAHPGYERQDPDAMRHHASVHPYGPSPYYSTGHAGDRGPAPPAERGGRGELEHRSYEAARATPQMMSPRAYQPPPPPVYHSMPQPPAGSFPHGQHGLPPGYAAPRDVPHYDMGSRQSQTAQSPRPMYDPARPEGSSRSRPPPPPPVDRYGHQRAPPQDYRGWNAGMEAGRDDPARYSQPQQGRPPVGYHESAQDPRHSQYGHFPAFSLVNERPSPSQSSTGRGGRRKRKDQKRAEDTAVIQEGPDMSFRAYQGGSSDTRPMTAQHLTHHFALAPAAAAPTPSASTSKLEPGQSPSGAHAQIHPGQRMGQQLLPASMDPSRPPTSRPASPHERSARHHGHSSSTTSARFGNDADAGAPGPTMASMASPPSNTAASPEATRTRPYAAASWQQQPQPAAYPGFEAQYGPPRYTTPGAPRYGTVGSPRASSGAPVPGGPSPPQQGAGHHGAPQQATPVMRAWQPEQLGGRPTTFIYASPNGEAATKSGRHQATTQQGRVNRTPSPPAGSGR